MVEEVEVGSAGEGVVAFVAEPIAADEIVATHDVDVVVCGLGPAGDASALACAEQGLKTVAVEKQNRGNYNSAPSAAPIPSCTSSGAWSTTPPSGCQTP